MVGPVLCLCTVQMATPVPHMEMLTRLHRLSRVWLDPDHMPFTEEALGKIAAGRLLVQLHMSESTGTAGPRNLNRIF